MNNTISADAIRATWRASAAKNANWLHELQEAALNEFSRTGFPTTRMENWKYTDVREVTDAYPNWLNNRPSAPTAAKNRELQIPDALCICFVDGVFSAELSRLENVPNGLSLGSIGDMAASNPEKIKARFGQLAKASDSGFIALNTAFAEHGAAILLEDGVQLERPIYLSYQTSTGKITTQPRLFIDMGKSSNATVIEHFCSSTAAIVNPVTEIFCADNARLDYYKLQEEHLDAWHTAAQYARLGSDSFIRTTHIDTGSHIARNELTVELAGQGAHAEATGLFIADGKRHVESRITVEHAAPHTTSRERFRGILDDQARGVFNGRIHVHQCAQKTSAELTNRNLLLSKGAEINTKPELEIYADDVKCAHGSTTGQLDATSMFYLLTRGISPTVARKMLIAAFAAELVADIELPALHKRVHDNLAALRAASD